MTEANEEYGRGSGSGGENPGVDEDVSTEGDEGRRSARSTPPIADDTEPGRTTSPPHEGEVGVPSDEEIAREEENA
jgi:hypothetical protein